MIQQIAREARSNGRAVVQLGLAALPWIPTSGPTRSSDVDPRFVTQHVASGVPGAVCEQVEPLDGTTGTTDRRRLGLTWNRAGKDAGLPDSVFAKSTPLSAKNRTMVAPLDMAVNEVRFYRDIRPGLDGHAPRCWYGHAGNGSRFLLLLEDLVAAGATPYSLADPCPFEHARAILSAQASLHAAMWETPRLHTDLHWVKRWSERPGYSVLKRIYRRGRNGMVKKLGDELGAAERHLADVLNRHDAVVYRAMEQGPLTVLHGDPHIGNTYGFPDGSAGYLDWQVVWQGPGLRDATYFLCSALDRHQRREALPELLQHYLDALSSHGVDAPPYEEAFQRLRLFAAESFDAGAVVVAWPGLQPSEGVAVSRQRSAGLVEDLGIAEAVEEAAAAEPGWRPARLRD